jgi:hypothetical protein
LIPEQIHSEIWLGILLKEIHRDGNEEVIGSKGGESSIKELKNISMLNK